MNKVLITADSIRGSREILSSLSTLVSPPKSVVLLHVEQLVGNATMTAMMSESELSTLRESVENTEHKETLDSRAEKVLAYYRGELERRGMTSVKSVITSGNPSDEILKVAEEEGVDLIVVGCSGKTRFEKLVTGCASKDVQKNARVRVLISKNNGCGEHAHLWSGRKEYAL